ncbi:CAP domain-containing protein [Conexibacter sp. SYSU D00693]|uniref:CAP domain-containing protein n=1 Tax=Conexibacter sp. SYSU D00693 TaxID=2812560 RepID=UPI00196B1DA5|nr:CAP domain-containing protein [Conexibacter sp. SYSU D00693]
MALLDPTIPAALVTGVLALTPGPSAAQLTRTVAASSASTATAVDEVAIRRCANVERGRRGLPALKADPSLSRAARLQAKGMAKRGYTGHRDPQGRGPAERVSRYTHRYQGVGENLAWGWPTGADACATWLASAPHRRNLLDRRFTHIGTGVAAGGRWGRYYVQVFGIQRAIAR